jgi:hypothetical protein
VIPTIIHQGWVGPTPPPDAILSFSKEMKRMNPEWDYRWFGNEIMEKYGNDPYVKYMVSRGEKWAFVMDRIRILLLKEHGGIWIDPDAKPVRPLMPVLTGHMDYDFISAFRSPYRPAVQVKRGVSLVDNTVMASRPNGRIINRLNNLWTSASPVRKGAEMGWEIMDRTGPDVLWLNPRIFYSEQPCPEAVILHDGINLASWTTNRPMQFAKPNGNNT